MFDLHAWLVALTALLFAGALTWLVSVAQRNVTIVDSLWPVLFILAALTYATSVPSRGPRTALVIALVSIWGLRLGGYLTWRNHGKPEDHRYQAIRARNEPNFAFKSLYLIFALQAVLAAVISVPLLGAINSTAPLGPLEWAGVALWCIGFAFEAGAAHSPRQGRSVAAGDLVFTEHLQEFQMAEFTVAGLGQPGVEGVEHAGEFEGA